MNDILDLEARYDSGVDPTRDLALVRGEGAIVYDTAGRRYIDCIAGIGAANVGHAHPRVVAAIRKQAGRLMVCPGIFSNDVRAELLQRLVKVAPGGMARAFLCNSGAEAVEAAIKLARLHTGRHEIVAAMRGFHGRTMGALSATWEKDYRTPFEPLVPGFSHVPYNDTDVLAAAITERTAAVLLEVVQGEGGVRPGSREFLQGAQAACQVQGALLIIDEVQSGYGRTGRLFACEHHDLRPDLLCVAKSMAGGLPMGGVLIGEALGEIPRKVHGSTMGGNPLACAGALATLDVLQEQDLVGRAARLGRHALERFSAIASPVVREARGLGLFLGLELRIKSAPVVRRLQDEGILVLQAGPTVIRMLPPLVIEEADLEHVLTAVEAAVAGDGTAASAP